MSTDQLASLQTKTSIKSTYGSGNSSWLKEASRPPPLFGHAMEVVPTGFVLFGGMSPAGLSDHLWFFNLTDLSVQLKATKSLWKPPRLTELTLTAAEGYLYGFGGSGLHGELSSQMFRISQTDLDQWEPVEVLGTKVTDLRVVGHTMVYSELCRYILTFFAYVVRHILPNTP